MIDPAAAVLLAAGVSAVAVLARWLTVGGAMAASLVGAAVLFGAGWGGGAMLATFFVSGSLLSGMNERARAARTADAKTGPRDTVQVLANGLPGAFAALVVPPLFPPTVVVGGAIAAAAADTWATEIGMALGRRPRLITTLQPVPPGTSGGVTLTGTAAALAGAATVGAIAMPFGLPPPLLPIVITAGWTGALLDSFAGAILQGRFRCERCNVETERRLHECGTLTVRVRGLSWLTNDGVNLLASSCGAGLAFLWLSLRWA